MLNFNYYNPCRLVFGRDAEKKPVTLPRLFWAAKGACSSSMVAAL